MKEVTLPSGRKLTITLAPFTTSRDLYQEVLSEMKHLKIEGNTEIDHNFFKDLACTALSSKKIEKAIWECMKRCLIDSLKISEQSFEDVDHRDDYLTVMFEVAKENLLPFTKSLYAQFAPILATLTQKNPS